MNLLKSTSIFPVFGRSSSRAIVWTVLIGFCLSLAACAPEDRPQPDDVRRRKQAAREKRIHQRRLLEGPEFVGIRFGPTSDRQNAMREWPRYKIVKILGAPIETHVGYAYGLHPHDVIFEGPLDQGEHYNAYIHPTNDQIANAAPMLRDYLRERFGFEARIEEREVDVLVLKNRRQGAVLVPSQSRKPRYHVGPGTIWAIRSPLSKLVLTLREEANLPIVDETGLDANYDFLLKWDPSSRSSAFLQSLDYIGLSLARERRTLPVLIVTPIASEPRPATIVSSTPEDPGS
jgi:uncharacterized protein (TIGR03435 family)